jgi:glycosyltransferase involved in cell wall biosynthesis
MRLCFISSAIEDRHLFIQPWRYLIHAAAALNQAGNRVYFLSDGYPRLPQEEKFAGYTVRRINSLLEWPPLVNKDVLDQVEMLKPDLVFWHLGLTSFMHLNTLRRINVPAIGLFTSPIYRPSELLRLGILRLLQDYHLSGIHLLGLLVPSRSIRRTVNEGSIRKLVVECQTTRTKLMQKGVPEKYLQVIRPCVDPAWFQGGVTSSERIRIREQFGFSPDDFIVGYFGDTAPSRGLQGLLEALRLSIKKNPHIRVFVLSRLINEKNRIDYSNTLKLIKKNKVERWVQIVHGFFSKEQLIRELSMCDAIALPFELVSSDVPVSVLETMALGIPLITTPVACLAEMVPEEAGIRVAPGRADHLAEAIMMLSSDPQLRMKLSRRGREEAFSWCSLSESHGAWNQLVLENASGS